jgi:hypothetical protein
VQNPSINISILEEKEDSIITIASTIGGQMIDYGTTAETVRDFCAELLKRQPNTTCSAQ